MSSGPNMFGRPMPELRQRSMTPPANADAMYNAYPKEGMYVPQQNLFNNALMLGMRNPMPSLGYGPAINPMAQQQQGGSVPGGVTPFKSWEDIAGWSGPTGSVSGGIASLLMANQMPSMLASLDGRYTDYKTAGGGMNQYDWYNQTSPLQTQQQQILNVAPTLTDG